MEGPLGYVLFFASVAFAAIGCYLDYATSEDGIYYAVREKNPIWKDKFGYFNKPKALILTPIILVGLFCLWFIPPIGNQLAILFGIVGTITMIVWTSNTKNRKNTRVKQIEKLRIIRNAPEGSYISPGTMNTRAGMSWYVFWPWIREPAGPMAAQKLTERIVDLSRKPESEWFPS